MTWVLIALTVLSSTEFDAYEIGRFDSMIDCFNTRELVLASTEAYSGIPNINEQYVCVKTEHK